MVEQKLQHFGSGIIIKYIIKKDDLNQCFLSVIRF